MQFFQHFARGLLMGGADIIPGVSGGTMALIVGIYERLVATIGDLFSFALSLLQFNTDRIKERFWAVDWGLLIPLGVGVLTAILTAARFIPYLLETYPIQCRAFFFGLILASAAIPWMRINQQKPLWLFLVVASFLAAFFATSLSPISVETPGLLHIFLGASIAICAMILPGVSGAFLLLVMGLYEPTLRAIHDRNLIYVLTFMLGAGIGIGLFSKLLTWLLEHYHDAMMAVLVGLMLGSLRVLWPWQEEGGTALQMPPQGSAVLPIVLIGIAGFLIICGFVLWSRRKMQDSSL